MASAAPGEEPRPPVISPPAQITTDPVNTRTQEPDQARDLIRPRLEHIATAEEGKTGDPTTDDETGFFTYTYTPPSDQIIEDFDSTQQLGAQLQDLVNDNLNTLTTDGKLGRSELAA